MDPDEERRKIRKMVADGVISPEEGANLTEILLGELDPALVERPRAQRSAVEEESDRPVSIERGEEGRMTIRVGRKTNGDKPSETPMVETVRGLLRDVRDAAGKAWASVKPDALPEGAGKNLRVVRTNHTDGATLVDFTVPIGFTRFVGKLVDEKSTFRFKAFGVESDIPLKALTEGSIGTIYDQVDEDAATRTRIYIE